MQGILSRARLLYDRGRYEHAEAEARRFILAEPEDPYGHALLALCLLKREDWSQALREVSEAVRLGPDVAYPHYVAGHVLLAADRHKQAMDAARAALQLEPGDPSIYGLIGAIHLEERRWRDALDAAERGLERDPEHVECNNVRGMALVKLGRRDEAGATMAQTLALDPEDAFTHANRGWALLHEGKPQQAMEHFREALRIDPTMDWARAGIVEALKAKNFVYRWMLAYFLYMSRLSSRAQWGIIFGGWIAFQVLKQVGRSSPQLAPFVLPLIVLYVVFVILTWLADPLFNLLLRVNRYGRLALSREQRIAANWVGGVLLAFAACVAGVFVLGWDLLVDVAIMTFLLTLPVSAVFRVPSGWPRTVMLAGIAALLALGAWHVTRMVEIGGMEARVLGGQWRDRQLLGTFGFGILLLTLAGNALQAVRIKKG